MGCDDGVVSAFSARARTSRAGATDDAPTLLRIDELALRGVFSRVSFDVRAGEVVGLAGPVGSGCSEILDTIAGARAATCGRIQVGGKWLKTGSVAAAAEAGIVRYPQGDASQVLLLDGPTRGADADERAAVHALIRELAARGAAVVVASELDEVIALADRVLVLAEGQVVDTPDGAPTGSARAFEIVMEGERLMSSSRG